MFGWVIQESKDRTPNVLTASEIARRLKIKYASALLLKRRVQLLASEQLPKFHEVIHEKLEREFQEFKLPKEGDVSKLVQGKSVVAADTVVLFSASQRANKGRKRHKERGQTASIYMSAKLGGRQVGTLVHVMGTQKGFVLLKSVPNQTMNTLGPLFKKHIPKNTTVFTDEAYSWLEGIYPNHRMINHSRKSLDKRYKWNRQRWSKGGIHNQVAEGLNSSLKIAMRTYRYFRPEYSQLYLNEWAFFKNWNSLSLQHFAFSTPSTPQSSHSASAGACNVWKMINHEARDCEPTGQAITPPILLPLPAQRRSRRRLPACG
ncbi:MAG: transposase [Spirochaetia bacterium]|nr:transposase [Spirochaetia bacterium]